MKDFQTPGRRFHTENYFRSRGEEDQRKRSYPETGAVIAGYVIFVLLTCFGAWLMQNFSGRGKVLVAPFIVGAVVLAILSLIIRKLVYLKNSDEPICKARFAVVLNIILVAYFLVSFWFSFERYVAADVAFYVVYAIFALFASLATAGFSVKPKKRKKPSRS